MWVCFLVFDPSVYTALLFLAMALHECGHLVALYLVGVRQVRMTLSAFGAEIGYAAPPGSHGAQIAVALGGIGMNLLTALPALLMGAQSNACLFFGVASFALAVLNLIPTRGLDGGRALEELLGMRMDPMRAYRTVQRVSAICVCLLLGLSVWVLIGSGFNFSLLLFTLYLSLSILR